MTNRYVTCFFLTFLIPFTACNGVGDAVREPKLISTFQVVRFPNDACTGSNSRNGTCYTSAECSSKDGSSSGSCADGFGVCCTFLITTCGKSSSENLTAWTQPTAGAVAGDCSLTVVPVSDDICALRLDFTTFAITGPNTNSIVGVRRRLGTPIENEVDAYVLQGSSYTTNCFVDAFYGTGASPSTNPPLVCGTLTGEHMYLEADVDRGNMLMFHFADATHSAISLDRGVTALATRIWDMTITHVECTSAVLPPTGCTKYFWNAAGRATLKNYNFSTTLNSESIHLAQQHERMCIRRERGFCVGCFSAALGDFDVSATGEARTAVHYTVPNGCCGYQTYETMLEVNTATEVVKMGDGNAGDSQFGWDCIIIPGAFTVGTGAAGVVDATPTSAELQQVLANSPSAAHQPLPQGPQICGTGGGIGPGIAILAGSTDTDANGILLAAGYANTLTVCTRHVPFMLEFMSDDLEGLGITLTDSEFTSNALNQGFSILHAQLAC